MKNLKKIFKAGIIGSFLGSIAGLLFAKRPGRETRKRWKEKIDQAKDKAVDVTKKVAQEAKEIKEELKEDANEIKEAFKEDKDK